MCAGVMGLAIVLSGCGDGTTSVDTQTETQEAVVELPKIALHTGYVITNEPEKLEFSDFADYTSQEECQTSFGYFEKVGELQEMTDTVAASYRAALFGQYTTEQRLDRSTDFPKQEGIYEAVCVVRDAQENLTCEPVLVVYDRTAPQFRNPQDVTLVLQDEQTPVEAGLYGNVVYDYVDGIFDEEQVSCTIKRETGEEEKYIVTVTCSDRAGNVFEGEFAIYVQNPQEDESGEEDSPEGTSGNPSSNNSNNTGNNNNNSGNNSSSNNNSNTNSNSNNSDSNNNNTGSNGSSNNNNSNSSNSTDSNNNNNSNSGNSTSGDNGSTGDTVASPAYMDDYASAVLEIVNAERAKEGLPALTMNAQAQAAAKVRAQEITGLFEHTRPNGESCFTALAEAGVSYYTAGENIAAGQWSAESVMESWMNSPGHRANILTPEFTEIGIACYYDPNTLYGYHWVQLFIGIN